METRQILGARYRLEERLGEGGMAVVWRAFDLVLGRWVAVKVLSATLATDEHFRESILAEAQAAARVSHPHLASVYDYGESLNRDGQPIPYVVMELLSGRTLTERLATGPLSARAGLRVCAEIASGLATAHAANLVHQDVKPGNVMLTPTGAKLVDFGVAAIAGAPDEAGPNGKIMGTPNYVAPERLIGGSVVPATDVYGLGLLIFRVLTGRLPWPPGKPRLSTRAQPEPLPAIEGVSPIIGELYLRCLAMNPDDRPTAREAASILAAAVGVRPVFGDDADGDGDGDDEDAAIGPAIGEQTTGEAAPPPPVPVGAATPPVVVLSERRYRAVAAVVVGLAAAVAAVVILTFDGKSAGPPAFADGGVPTTTAAPPPPRSGGPVGSQSPGGGAEPGQVITTVIDGTTTTITLPPPLGPGSGTGGGGGGGGVPSTTTDPGEPPPSTATSNTRTFSYGGNTVVAECLNGNEAHIISWSTASGYKTTPPPRRGPDTTAQIWFRMQSHMITMIITCDGGVPEAQVTETSPREP